MNLRIQLLRHVSLPTTYHLDIDTLIIFTQSDSFHLQKSPTTPFLRCLAEIVIQVRRRHHVYYYSAEGDGCCDGRTRRGGVEVSSSSLSPLQPSSLIFHTNVGCGRLERTPILPLSAARRCSRSIVGCYGHARSSLLRLVMVVSRLAIHLVETNEKYGWLTVM